MALAIRGGSLVKRGASLGSGQACCCGGDGSCPYCSAGPSAFSYTAGGVTYWVHLALNGVWGASDETDSECNLPEGYGPSAGRFSCLRARVDGGGTGVDWLMPASDILNVVDGVFFAPSAPDPVSIAHGTIVLYAFLIGGGEVWVPLLSDCSIDTENIRYWNGSEWSDDWSITALPVFCTLADGSWSVTLCADCAGRCDGISNLNENCDNPGSGTCCYGDGTHAWTTKADCEAADGSWTIARYVEIALTVSACFGTGAAGKQTTCGLKLTNPGSGYAKFGRVAPTLTISGGSGSGATFTPTLTSTNDACGIPTWAITSVATSGGTGYAGNETLTVTKATGDTQTTAAVVRVQTAPRSQPSLTASATTGTGATFTVSTASNGGAPETWRVSAVTYTGTTSGYADNSALSFTGGTQGVAADVRVRTKFYAPTVTATAGGTGSGASLSVTLSPSGSNYSVASVAVTSGGTGYTDGDPVTFTVTDGTQTTAATGTVVCGRENPNLTPYVFGMYDGTPTTGTGASLSATMEPNGDEWTVASITILNGGSGYQVGEFIWYYELTEFGDNPPYFIVALDGYWITSVDGSGAITGIGLDPDIFSTGLYYKQSDNISSVAVTDGGSYYKTSGEIDSIQINSGGQYYYYTGTPTSVTVENGGVYYREDASEPPYVAEVTFAENGNTYEGVVDDSTGSGTFGQITGILP